MLNVCDNNMYKAQTYTSFHYSNDKYTGQWHCESTLKDELPDPRESLVNEIPSHTIEQANQETQQDNHQ